MYHDISLKTLRYFFVPSLFLIPVNMFAGTGGPNDELELIFILIFICAIILAINYLVSYTKYHSPLMDNNLNSTEIEQTEDSPDDHPIDNQENHAENPVL